MLEILLGHPEIVGDKPGQIHGVVDAGVVQIEGELVVFLDPLLDLFQFFDLYAQERLLNAMLQQHLLNARAAEGRQFFDNFCRGHGDGLAKNLDATNGMIFNDSKGRASRCDRGLVRIGLSRFRRGEPFFQICS